VYLLSDRLSETRSAWSKVKLRGGEGVVGSNDPLARDCNGKRTICAGVGDRRNCIRLADATCKRRVCYDCAYPNRAQVFPHTALKPGAANNS
jgi:hypothetical protein